MESYLSRWTDDQDFVKLHNDYNLICNIHNVMDNAMYARIYILRQLAKQQSIINPYLDFAECGVYAGMTMFFTAEFCDKTFIGIDSWEGVSEPGEFDTEYFKTIKLKSELAWAKNNLSRYPNVLLKKGWIPEVFDEVEESKYSFVHIDVDLYEPTKKSIEYFWPKIVPGGVLICDDYGSYKTTGARKAVDDYFEKHNILELPTGQAIIWKK
jgi:O-methyltransferase